MQKIHKNFKLMLTTSMVGLILALTGCAGSKGGDVYSREDARRPMSVRMATVEGIRAVKLEGTKSPLGAGAGAVVGGLAGSGVARDAKGQAIGAVLGAVVGGIAGALAEERGTREDAVEITVRTEDGKLMAYVQAGDVNEFKVGERVRILGSGGETRVSH
jgi:outer membrane lipoprotein SlyB